MVERFEYSAIPHYTRKALRDWVFEGRPPGGFLTAVLRNELSQAVAAADNENLRALVPICMFLYNRMPSPSWGSREKVEAWPEKLHQMTEDGVGFTFGPFDEDEAPEHFPAD